MTVSSMVSGGCPERIPSEVAVGGEQGGPFPRREAAAKKGMWLSSYVPSR
jgi:hypothetical protein